MTTLEGNKLIAEFMGATMNQSSWYKGGDSPYTEGIIYDNVDSPTGANHFVDLNDIKYHSSWDWLMPVVTKIGEMQNQSDSDFFEAIEEANLQMFNTSIFCHYDELYKRVVQFIQWYNNQNTPAKVDDKKGDY